MTQSYNVLIKARNEVKKKEFLNLIFPVKQIFIVICIYKIKRETIDNRSFNLRKTYFKIPESQKFSKRLAFSSTMNLSSCISAIPS